MSEFSTSFFKSFAELTKFFQITATRLLEEPVHSDGTVLDLTRLCLQEAEGNGPELVVK